MNYKDLIEYLDIENGAELRYFEEIADLIESDEHIDYDALLKLFEEVDRNAVAELLDEYFNDITDGIPEDYSELFSLLEQIRMELTGVIRSISDDNPESVRNFTDRFYRFRNWYVYDTEVSVLDRNGSADGRAREYEQSVRDAIDVWGRDGALIFWDGGIVGSGEDANNKRRWVADELQKYGHTVYG